MSLADPSSMPLSSGSVNFTRINGSDPYASEWRATSALCRYILKVRHTKVAARGTEPAKDRHNVELTRVTFATSTVPEYSEKAYFVSENIQSSTSVELPNALAIWLTASTNAQLIKLTNWEN